jgi:hypothetical protein
LHLHEVSKVSRQWAMYLTITIALLMLRHCRFAAAAAGWGAGCGLYGATTTR